MIAVAGPINSSSAHTLVELPPADKTGISNGYIGYCAETPDIAFMRGNNIKLIDTPVVSFI
jgi:hypothetical protein